MLLRGVVLGAFAALAAAQSDVLSFTRVPNPVTDGEANVLLWATNNTNTPVEIVLQQGPVSALKNITTVTTAGTGGQYIWHPPVSLADGTNYQLLIIQGNQNNTFGPFVIQGASPAAVSSASLASSASSASAANATRTKMTASMGTGTAMHRNTTMSFAHLTTKHHTTTHTNTHTTTSKVTATTAIATSSSGAAVADISTSSSSLALVLGAMAAIFYLQ